MVIQAFFDESGTEKGSPVTCVGGYLFEAEQLLRFDAEWREMLNQFGLKYFRMSECAHNNGEFKERPLAECVEVEKRAIGIIKRRALVGMVCTVRQEDYLAVAAGSRGYDGAYVLCLQWCMIGVAGWVHKHRIAGSVGYFFEAGHALQKIANEAMDALSRNPKMSAACLYQSHTFLKKGDGMALEAADILSWQWQKDWRNRMGEIRRPRRADLQSLIGLPTMCAHFEKHHLAVSRLRGGAYTLDELYAANRLDSYLDGV